MNHQDHVRLIRDGAAGPAWADLGSGNGAFTLALAELLGSKGIIYSVDQNGRALRRQEERLHQAFPRVTVHYHQVDFTSSLEFLPPLDGILMANSLHFIREKVPLLRRLRSHLEPDGSFLIVEYDTDRGNRWVPYPLTYGTWSKLARNSGFAKTTLLRTHPSSFLGHFYSAISTR